MFPFFLLETDIKGYKNDIDIILNDRENSYYYSNVSLIELKWQYIKLEKSKDRTELQSKFNRFHNIVIKDKRLTMINHISGNINLISDYIRNEGHTDYFDSLISASSLWCCDLLITEDDALKKVTTKVNKTFKINNYFNIFNWEKLRAKLLSENNDK